MNSRIIHLRKFWSIWASILSTALLYSCEAKTASLSLDDAQSILSKATGANFTKEVDNLNYLYVPGREWTLYASGTIDSKSYNWPVLTNARQASSSEIQIIDFAFKNNIGSSNLIASSYTKYLSSMSIDQRTHLVLALNYDLSEFVICVFKY